MEPRIAELFGPSNDHGNINPGVGLSAQGSCYGVGLPKEDPIGAEDYPIFYEIWGRKSPYGQVVCFPDSVPNPIRALIVTGGNPLISMPDSNAFREAFKRLDLLVVHDFFMSETAELAHYVLPACTHLEKNGLAYSYNVCHGMPYLMLRKKAIEPLYESWSEFKFWTELAKKTGMGDVFPWKTDDEVVELELKPSGLNYRELKEEKVAGAYYMEKQYGMDALQVKGFPTPSKKIEIYSETLEKAGFDPLPTYLEPHQSPLGDPQMVERYPLVLTTGARILYFTHGQHRNIGGLKEKCPEPLQDQSQTADEFGIKDGDRIVESNRDRSKSKPLSRER
jgi:anaerobic selenocysteine-containing dehydrogenase